MKLRKKFKMHIQRNGFSLVEMILMMAIIGMILSVSAPIMIKKYKVASIHEKIRCIDGARHVVLNNTNSTKTGTLRLPPNIKTIYVTMTGGGGGGSSRLYQANKEENAANDAGAGGGGAAFLYKQRIDIDLASATNLNNSAVIRYSIGGGGSGGCSHVGDDVSSIDTTGESTAPYSNGSSGGNSTIEFYDDSITNKLSAKIYNRANTSVATTSKTLTISGGGGGGVSQHISGRKEEGNYYRSKLFYDPNAKEDYQWVNIPNNALYGGSGGTGSTQYTYSGENGETSSLIVPGIGGASAFGRGSYGSGGSGGIDAKEKNMNLRTGVTSGRRRCGENGAGGILIIEYDSYCE